jgi:hypothetical protein
MKTGMMKKTQNGRQRGIALISVLLVLILLIVLGVSLMYVADTDTAINSNYRSEQQAYFAAKAGIEEVRNRMRRTQTDTVDAKPPGISLLPTTVASDAGGVLYMINQGTDPITVQPWVLGNRYQDDEFCHDGYTLAGIPAPGSGNVPSDDVRCINNTISYLPSSTTWYNHPATGAPAPGWVTSTAPFNGTSAAMPYKWVRITWKQNNSIQGSGTAPYYSVDGSAPGSPTGNTPVCWDGSKEVLLTAPATKCEQMPTGMRPVYLATSLAVSGGSRRMVQSELAKNVLPTFPAALALDGPEVQFGPYSSANAIVSGWDAAASGGGTPCPPAGNWPAIGTYTAYDATQVIAALNGAGAKPANYTGGPGNTIDFNTLNVGPWGQYMDSTGLTPAAPQNSSPFYPGNLGNLNTLSTVSGLVQLQQTIIGAADNIYASGASATIPFGTDTNPQVTVVTGDASFHNNGLIGAGILLVEGVLQITGNTNFDGAIYVVGKGEFDTDGTPSYGGQVLIANIVTNPPCVWSAPACGAAPNPTILAVLKAVYGPTTTQYPAGTPGSPIFNGAGGGSNGGVAYNSCKANLGNDRIPYRVLATREILY